MKDSKIWSVFLILLFVLFSTWSSVDALCPPNNSKTIVPVPDGLNPGDKVHFVFVTSITIDGRGSGSFTSYDNHVRTAAASIDLETNFVLPSTGDLWFSIISTPLSGARDRVPLEGRVYRLDQVAVALRPDEPNGQLNQLWDGNLMVAINIDECKRIVNSKVWTHSGGKLIKDGKVFAVGFSSGSTLEYTTGNSNVYWNETWIAGTKGEDKFQKFPVYALSAAVTVPLKTVAPQGIVTNPVVLEWYPKLDARHYRVAVKDIRKNAWAVNQLVQPQDAGCASAGSRCLYRLPQALEPGEYYWIIRYYDSNGWSAYSPPRAFAVSK